MDISAFLAFLATTAGKVAAGAAVTAASVGGLAAADVVELPTLPGETSTVVVTERVDGATVSGAARDGKAGTVEKEIEAEESKTDAGRQDADVRQDSQSQGIGGIVSEDAQDGGVDGEVVAGLAQENRPELPEQSQVPADAGSQADAAPGSQAPQDAGSEADAEAGSQAPVDPPANDAGDNPADQADQDPGTQADEAQDRRDDS